MCPLEGQRVLSTLGTINIGTQRHPYGLLQHTGRYRQWTRQTPIGTLSTIQKFGILLVPKNVHKSILYHTVFRDNTGSTKTVIGQFSTTIWISLIP